MVALPQGGTPNIVNWNSLPPAAPAPQAPPETPKPLAAPMTVEQPVAPAPQAPAPVTVARTCEPQMIEKRQTNKLDVIFIVDTSASLNSERARVAQQMNNFVESLDPKTDYQIGVVLAHAPSDREYPCFHTDKKGQENKRACEAERAAIRHNKMGQLYSRGPSDPAVLRYSEIRDTKKIMRLLERKMQNPLDDKSPAQGELGLYNAYKIMTDPTLKQAIVSQGMFRKDAVVAIFFISDEQDVCYNYKLNKQGARPAFEAKFGKTPATPSDLVNDVAGRDPREQWTYENICNIGPEGKPLQYYDVLDASKAFASELGVKVTFNGAIYTDNASIPRCFKDKSRRQNCPSGKTDLYADEKEIGWGFTDLIRASHIDPINLSARDFGTQLANLGVETSVELIASNVLTCKMDSGDPTQTIQRADQRSFKVELEDRSGQVISTLDSTGGDSSLYAVPETDVDGQHLHVVLPRKLLKKALKDGAIQAKITFNERTDGTKDGVRHRILFRPHRKIKTSLKERNATLEKKQERVEKKKVSKKKSKTAEVEHKAKSKSKKAVTAKKSAKSKTSDKKHAAKKSLEKSVGEKESQEKKANVSSND